MIDNKPPYKIFVQHSLVSATENENEKNRTIWRSLLFYFKNMYLSKSFFFITCTDGCSDFEVQVPSRSTNTGY